MESNLHNGIALVWTTKRYVTGNFSLGISLNYFCTNINCSLMLSINGSWIKGFYRGASVFCYNKTEEG